MKDEELVNQELQRIELEQSSTEVRLRNLENAIKGQVMANTSFDKRLESLEHHTTIDRDRITPHNLPEWIDAKVNPPPKDPLGPPVWATIEKECTRKGWDGLRSVELVVYEEGMGWQITDDYRGEVVRCEVGHGVITHWMPFYRPLYPAT